MTCKSLAVCIAVFATLLTLQQIALAQALASGNFEANLRDKLETYLIKDPSLYQRLEINHQGVKMFASEQAKKNGKTEIQINKDEIETFRQMVLLNPLETALETYQNKDALPFSQKIVPSMPQRSKPYQANPALYPSLKGLKVAIDPGHTAGDMEMAMLEEKCIKMRLDKNPYCLSIEFNEGTIALDTALVLKDMLSAQGAIVKLTRSEPGRSAFDKTFEQWLAQDFRLAVNKALSKKELTQEQASYLLTKADKRYIFHHFFKQLDFKERARKINAFQPDLTVVIHYNADEKNRRQSDGSYHPTQANYIMAFVPGAFTSGELDEPVDRMLFLYLLFSDTLDKSINLSNHIVQALSKELNVPIVDQNAGYEYLTRYSKPTKAKGVFARNLNLLRYIHSPICYGESLYQDNAQEAVALNDRSFDYKGMKLSKRVYQVAVSYYKGIVNYVYSSK